MGMSDAGSICERLREARVVPVLRFPSAEQARFSIDCLLDAGFTTVEITLTTPDALGLVAELRARLPAEFLLGAGTIMSEQQAQACVSAGADYLVTPCEVEGVVDLAHDAGKAALTGAFTPSEVFAAVSAGSDIVKLFPASTGGPSHLAALKAVFPQVCFCPTGGVNTENITTYLDAGADLVGVGNSIIDKEALRLRDRNRASTFAKRYLQLAGSRE
jgi:2-dehydro-3-deoxyphosphogluconate aldolase/(4S)-4-hydroxy-2-oxoglutarate aldolase